MELFHKCFIFGAVLVYCNVVVLAQSGPLVTTPSGDVLGSYMTSARGRQFSAFRGIPFGKPPVGDLRFAAPVKADPWTGVFNATEEGPFCYQHEILFEHVYKGQEDCLTVNVYSPALPSTNSSTLLPVLVFIFGGAFLEGEVSSNLYGPQRHMDHDLVLVLINYRLGPFGFLSTYDAAAPGNAGMLDQVLGLQWVRDNVAAFGGNPNDVTLSGESAGSDSVSLHILSPASAGLFHKAILESGNALTPWGMIENPKQYAVQLADKFNCSTNDSYQIVACLREQTMEDLYKKSEIVLLEGLQLTFVPVIENPNQSPLFLWEDPHTLLKEGRFNKVPLIGGFNRDEGCLIYFVVEPLGMFRNINTFFFDVNVPIFLSIFTDYRDNLINVSYAIKELYYDPIDLNDTALVTRTNIDLLSDMFMIPWVFQFNNLVANHSVPVYTYAMNYIGQYSASNFTGEPDAIHAIELVYLFNISLSDLNLVLNARDSAFSDQFLGLWTNFVINGNPTPSGSPFIWETTPFESTVHLDLNEQLSMLPEYQKDRMNFWLFEVPKIVAGTN